jgi:hypothetical protein
MKQCVSQCSLGRVPHDCRHTTRIRQGIAHISREGRADSPQIIIRRAYFGVQSLREVVVDGNCNDWSELSLQCLHEGRWREKAVGPALLTMRLSMSASPPCSYRVTTHMRVTESVWALLKNMIVSVCMRVCAQAGSVMQHRSLCQ